MATVKHIKIYNANYDAATDYLTMQHNEFTGKPILDDRGRRLPRDYYLIDGINCDPYSFNEECSAVNAKFHKNNTYKEIKAHHYIVSFDPRDREENNLTPEHAQELGMELAQKAFPGHQVIVCTHKDGHNGAGNIHCHIVINSVRKSNVFNAEFEERPSDSIAGNKHHASKAFMEFFKQSTMDICQREDLYQVDLLSPAKVRITDREYWAERRGQKKLDRENKERIEQGKEPVKTKYETTKSILRKKILSVLSDSQSLDEFKDKLLEQYGIALEESRGRFSYHLPDREKPIRGRQLGIAFEKETIIQTLTDNRKRSVKRTSSIALIVDLKACIKAKENQYYARKVKVSNLQQMAKTLAFLQENNIGTKEELEKLLSSTKLDQQTKHDVLLEAESQLKKVNQMIHYTGQYQANKSTYTAFLKSNNKSKFRQEHESEILLYETARKELKRLYDGEKFKSLKSLYEEKNQLIEKKNALYEDYFFSRAKYRELQTVNTNVTTYLSEKDITEDKNKVR